MNLARHDFKASVAPLRTARSMPSGFYTDPEISLEREHIFLKQWFFIGREEQFANSGDYRAVDTPGGPIVTVRGRDGKLRCFANYCRHRGSILLEGEGNCGNRIICPYHAWSYINDGTLYGCPDMQDAEGFDRVENGLVPLRTESWEGYVFASFSEDVKPLIEHLGDFPERFASHKLGQMRCTWKVTLEAQCNWKLLLENSMETYHTGIVHKHTVGAQKSRTLPTRGDWICIQVLSDRSIATLPGQEPPFPPIPDLDEDAKLGTYFTVIYPTTQFAVSQDALWWLNVTPVSVDRSVLEIGGCFPESAFADPKFAEKALPYYERWEAVGREDVGILEKQQRALASALYKPGPLSGRDDMVQALGVWVLDRLPI